MSMIKISNLNKSYGNSIILSNVNLSIDKGDVVAVIGPSGNGKTTLLRCMNFLEKSDSGIMEFEGVSYNLGHIKHKEIKEIRKKTAFVFQNYNLFANKTAVENVMLGLKVARKIPKDEAYSIATNMLDKVGLSDKYNYYPIQLSGGQQQRVAIARALATNPDIIYFDEPTSALDPELIGEVLNVIKKLASEGMTMIVVTHELNFARSISNKVVFMDKGNVSEVKTSKEFFENPDNDRVKEFLQNINLQHEV